MREVDFAKQKTEGEKIVSPPVSHKLDSPLYTRGPLYPIQNNPPRGLQKGEIWRII
jgi:hypothetical protein